MNSIRESGWAALVAVAFIVIPCAPAPAQECYSGTEIDGKTFRELQAAANQYYKMSAEGDVADLHSNATPEIAANFSAIEKAVVANKPLMAQAQPGETRIFVLDASNSKTIWPRADFYCGIYNSPDRVGISIPNLPPARYALTITRASGKQPVTLTLVLQESGNGQWKLAGYYARTNTLGSHDGQWFMYKAREYKEKGQLYNAWFYDLAAWDLLAPVDFLSTPLLDKLSDDMQAVRPPDLPGADRPLLLTGGGKTFKVVEVSAVPINDELWVRAQYVSTYLGNPQLASSENAAVMKALVDKLPQLRDAFAGVVARASDGAGHDYVTLTPMKDLK